MKRLIMCGIILILILPSLFAIKEMTVNEGDPVKIKVRADDPDNDKLEITYSYPFDRSGSWTPPYDSAGKYYVGINISDGVHLLTQEIKVIVKNVEVGPDLSFIQKTYYAKEGELFDLDLPEKDPDGDPVIYYITPPLRFDGKWAIAYNESGTYNIEINAIDNKGNNETKRFSIVVEDTPIEPVFSQKEYDVREGETLTIPLPADPAEENIIYSVLKGPESIYIIDNTIEYTPSYETVISSYNWLDKILFRWGIRTPAKRESKQLKVTIGMQKQKEHTKQAQELLFTVHNSNRLPIINIPEMITLQEGEVAKLVPAVNDLDNDPYKITYAGDFTTPVIKTEFGDHGIYNVKIIAFDGLDSDEKEVIINVTKLNRPPQLEKRLYSIKENNQGFIPVQVTDPNGDDIEIRLGKEHPTDLSIVDNMISWSPSYDTVPHKKNWWNRLFFDRLGYTFSSTFRVPVEISDGKVIVLDQIYIKVLDENRKPIAEDFVIKINEGEKLELPRTGKDYDNDHLAYTFSGIGALNNKILDYDSAGKHDVAVTVSDGPSEASFSGVVEIINNNRAPIFSVKDQIVIENETLEITLEGTDPDLEKITYKIVAAPDGVALKDNVLRYKPSFDVVKLPERKKEFLFIVGASDTRLQTNASFTVVVTNKNRKPIITKTSPKNRFSTSKNTRVRFTVDAVDPDGDELSYTWKPTLFSSYPGDHDHIRQLVEPGVKHMKVVVSDGVDDTAYTWTYQVR